MTMTQNRLNTWMFVSVELKLAVKVNINAVIDDFKTNVEHERRMISWVITNIIMNIKHTRYR